jgi:hypothetical protein
MLRKIWCLFLARFRLDLNAVCEMSRGRGPHEDFHDYDDSKEKVPMHFYEYSCERCGKKFFI